jgi:ligand-binding SRPBCC domain-containing protein
MSLQIIKRSQLLQAPIDEVWDFFTTPQNLDHITPPDMHLKVNGELPPHIYSGLLIHYTIKPLMHVPMRWTTQIKCVVDHKMFVDVQLKGPYKLWRHEHYFEEVETGTLVTDVLYYDIGISFLGNMVDSIFVKNKLNKLFDFRKQQIPLLLRNCYL